MRSARASSANADAPPPPRADAEERRFVVQLQDVRRQIFELRLEVDGVLHAWCIARGPSSDPRSRRLAVRNGQHPVETAKFEGQLPGGQGVLVWDHGAWRPETDEVAKALAAGSLCFELEGERMHGRWSLTRLKADGRRESWVLVKERDAFSEEGKDLAGRFSNSVVTGRSLAEIARWAGRTREPAVRRGPFPPMLCTNVERLAEGRTWLYEIEYDGYRMQLAKDGEGVVLHARNGSDWADLFPGIARAAAALDGRVVLDGEVVAPGRNGSGFGGFSELAELIADGTTERAALIVFDVLVAGGADVRARPLLERKRILARLLAGLDSAGPIRPAPCVPRAGQRLLDRVIASGGVGMVAKDATSTYAAGRSEAWQKLTLAPRTDVAVIGFVPAPAPGHVTHLVVGERAGGKIAYRGRIRCEAGETMASALGRRLAPLARAAAPAEVTGLPATKPRGASWVAPRLTASIRYRRLTAEGLLKDGEFLGLREDLPPAED